MVSGVDILTLRVQVPNSHILVQNLHYNYYYPTPKSLIIGYLDPLGYPLLYSIYAPDFLSVKGLGEGLAARKYRGMFSFHTEKTDIHPIALLLLLSVLYGPPNRCPHFLGIVPNLGFRFSGLGFSPSNFGSFFGGSPQSGSQYVRVCFETLHPDRSFPPPSSEPSPTC